jgi:urea transport system substrate-binding protein
VGLLTLVEEEWVAASPAAIFDSFASPGDGAGWLFGARCDDLVRGAVVRFDLPLSSGCGGLLQGLGRIVDVRRPRRIVLEHESPWRGRLTITVTAVGAQSRVRLVVEIPEEALQWLLRRRGVLLDPEATAGEVPIGLLVSRSGPGSYFAGACENLAQLAVEEINEAGPPGGRPLRLVVADDGTSPVLGAAEAQRLVDVEGCRVVVAGVTCGTFEAIQPVVERSGALLIFSLANEGGRTGPRLFRLGERPAAQLAAAVPWLTRHTGGTRWYLAGNAYCWPRAIHRQARPAVARAGGTVAGEVLLPLGTRDFSPLLEDIERFRAELVLSTFVGADEAEFERQFHDAGLRDRCATLAPALDEATREHIGDRAGTGIWTVFGYFAQLPSEANHLFLQRYRTRFSELAPPVSSFSESVYEAVHLAAEAAARAGSWDPTAVGHALGSLTFDGARGLVELRGPGHLEQPLYIARTAPEGFAVQDRVS